MNRQTKIGIAAIAAVVLALSVMLWTSDTEPIPQDASPKLQALSSFYPINEFAQAVGKDRADIDLLTPGGADPHDWEPTIQDAQRMQSADLIIINGLDFEAWVDNLEQTGYPGAIVDTSAGIVAKDFAEHGDDEHGDDEHGDDEHGDDEHGDDEHGDDEHGDDEHGDDEHGDDEHGDDEHGDDEHGDDEHGDDEHGDDEHGDDEHGDDEHGHGHGSGDPHIWLNPTLAKIQVQNIADAFSTSDPQNRDFYQDNAAAYILQLDSLDSKIRGELSGCNRDFIAYHNAFAYLADEYNLVQHTVVPSSDPHAEPTAQRLEMVIDKARELGLSVVFTEEGVDPRVPQVVADEIGGRILLLSPLEIADDADYITRMTQNLDSLKEALC